MQTTLLFFHILGVGAWLGANITQFALAGRFSSVGGTTAATYHRGTVAMGRMLYTPAALLVLITGILLITTGEEGYGFDAPFISIGFFAVIIGAGMAMALFAPRARKAADLHETGDKPAAVAVERQIATFGWVDTVVILVAIAAMIGRWGT